MLKGFAPHINKHKTHITTHPFSFHFMRNTYDWIMRTSGRKTTSGPTAITSATSAI